MDDIPFTRPSRPRDRAIPAPGDRGRPGPTSERRAPYQRRSRGKARSTTSRRLIILILVTLLFSCLVASWLSKGKDARTVHLSVLAVGPRGEIPENSPVEREPDVAARAAVLMDSQTEEVLYRKNDREHLPMASTTKIMTALLVIENCSLDEMVLIGEEATRVGESSGWLTPGETLTVEQLLHALLLQSGNDAATALAVHVGGSVEAFVDMMNRKAEEIGALDTHFANPHGLDQEGHYTTAYDLALIAARAMRLDTFRRIVSTSKYEVPWPGHPSPRVYYNKNKLLKSYPNANGIKTGYTLGAGKCLVASASHGGMELISVVLNSDDYWNQSAKLLDYGFNNFVRLRFPLGSLSLPPLKVGNFPTKETTARGTDILVTVRRDRVNEYIVARGYYKSWVPYPVRKGDEVGRLEIGPGEEEREVTLATEEEVLPPGFFRRSWSFAVKGLGMAWKAIRYLVPGI